MNRTVNDINMDSDTVNKLLISLDTIVENHLEEAILTDADQTVYIQSVK